MLGYEQSELVGSLISCLFVGAFFSEAWVEQLITAHHALVYSKVGLFCLSVVHRDLMPIILQDQQTPVPATIIASREPTGRYVMHIERCVLFRLNTMRPLADRCVQCPLEA